MCGGCWYVKRFNLINCNFFQIFRCQKWFKHPFMLDVNTVINQSMKWMLFLKLAFATKNSQIHTHDRWNVPHKTKIGPKFDTQCVNKNAFTCWISAAIVVRMNQIKICTCIGFHREKGTWHACGYLCCRQMNNFVFNYICCVIIAEAIIETLLMWLRMPEIKAHSHL